MNTGKDKSKNHQMFCFFFPATTLSNKYKQIIYTAAHIRFKKHRFTKILENLQDKVCAIGLMW